MNSPRSGRLQRGLTLLELGIAMALLVVLGAVAVPSLYARLDQQRLYSAAEALVSDANEARFEAARQGRALHIVMQGGDSWCWAVVTQPGCPCGQAQACELRSAQPRDHAGVRLLDTQMLHFSATGTRERSAAAAAEREAGGSNGVTLESRRGSRLRVDVQALGRAHVCTPGGSATRYPAC